MDIQALSGIDIALWDLKGEAVLLNLVRGLTPGIGRTLGVPVYELLGGQVRHKVQVYAWIGGDRPKDVEVAA
jgi:galactonate dehydratase